MSFFILLFLVVDGIILAASQYTGSAWGAAVCNNSLGFCAYTVPLLVAAVIGIGLYYVQR